VYFSQIEIIVLCNLSKYWTKIKIEEKNIF